jgi:hypothetical protein
LLYKINAKESDYLYIKTSQILNAGKGLYTAIDIHKNEVISIFKGKILTQEQIKYRINLKKDNYFINMIDGSILDSKNTKCFAKYANDASNCSSINLKNNSKITLDEDNNVCLVATKNIKANDELFCSYGAKYWKKHK